LLSIGQALLVVLIVWFVAYLIARKFGLDKDFASILASGVSICGVSAAISAGGAIKDNPKHVSYVISLVLLVAMPMLILMPLFSHLLGLTPAVAGAWIGGTIDTTAAVAAAGTLVDPETGLQVATLVKMAQNVLIGFAAFFLAIWSTFATSKNSITGKTNERIRLIDIWFRLPKFILGFIVASAIFSFIVEPTLGDKVTGSILGITRGYREWFFALAFVSIGLDTRIRELIVAGRGKPAMAFISAQLFNIMWAFLIAWLLWSGKLFASPLG
ncbi:MAG: YeiH family protein, partial [Dehalococcoidales bacterium]|nr:YeiH family protein [Dehalococcoidales bacterium]